MVITLSRYEAGEVIVQENDLGDTAYLIEQGQVEVSKELDGHHVHLAYLSGPCPQLTVELGSQCLHLVLCH